MTAQAAFSQAEKFYERRRQLFEQGAIPNRDLLMSQTDLATAKANFEVAQRTLALLEKQSSGKDIQIAESRLEQAQGRLAAIEAQIAFTELRSPFPGTVIEQFVFPGDMAQPSAPIFTIADLGVAVARAQVPESDAVSLRRGESCRFYPTDREGTHFDGIVTVVNQSVDPARRTVEIWCEIPNTKAGLRAQVFGSLEIITGKLTKAVTIPSAAVQWEEGTRQGFVMVVDSGNQAKRREILTGVPSGGKVVVLKGLRPGEAVITNGAYGLEDGAAIKISEAKQ
jgi:RND family efflux transporter MFP subunit